MVKLSYWKEKLKVNRRQLELDLLVSPDRFLFSPIYFAQYQVTLPLMQKFIKGRLLDLGCGDLPFKDKLLAQVSCYDTLDLFPRDIEPTFTSDIQNMSIVPSENYNSAICLEVLEHIPDPLRAIHEMYRILVPGGVLIVSVPHLSRLHDEPHDYYRYTRYGLTYLLEQVGFTIICLEPRGGLFSFLGHQISTIVLGSVWPVLFVRKIAWFLNSWLITKLCYHLDSISNLSEIFTAGYTVVAMKRK